MLLSIVIPVYNEALVLPLMTERLNAIIQGLDLRTEVILVDDGSRDASQEIMRSIVGKYPNYTAVILSRNYGHQIALSSGLEHTRGDAVVVLDADLQDPPELIPQMIARWREGFHVVYAQRSARHGESWFKKTTASIFYVTIHKLSGLDIPRNVGDFRLMDRRVVDALNRMPERLRFVRGMVSWVGFRSCPISFERSPRAAGTTKYPLRKMIGFAIDAIFSFSTVLLRLATYAGLLVFLLSGLLVIRALYIRFVVNDAVPGFTAIYVLVSLLGGLNLLFLGVLGEYIGRIYLEAKGRPLYFVQEVFVNQREKEHT